MKEHFQDYGVRKWAGDDLIELQKESLDALQGLVEPYAPCIIKGCDVASVGNAYEVKAGLAALRGVDVDGQACVKIVRVEAFNTPTLPVYLSLAHDQLSRAYADGSSKVIANDYIAVLSAQASEDALELTAGGGKRLVDTIGITQKLDRVGGEAKDIIVSFVEAATRSNLENKSKLGVLIGQIRKWFSDLRTLAFKDKVAKSDLDAALTIELDNKVVKVAGKELSTNDLTDALLDRLNSVEKGANNYSLPDATAEEAGGVKLGSDTVQSIAAVSPKATLSRTYPVQKDSNGRMVVNVPWVNTTYSAATESTQGLMSAADKKKLNGIDEGANKYTHPSHTAQSSGLYKITVDASGHVTAVTAVTKADITNLGIPGQDTNTTYSAATTTSAGLMSAADKTKLNNIASNANNYTHPTGAGNNHIPSGGAAGNYLKYNSSGVAVWGGIETVDVIGNKSSCSVAIYPGSIVRLADDNVIVVIKKATEAQLKKNNVAYVSNSGWKLSKFVCESGVTPVIGAAAKKILNTSQAGLWRLTWHDVSGVFIEFIQCDAYSLT